MSLHHFLIFLVLFYYVDLGLTEDEVHSTQGDVTEDDAVQSNYSSDEALLVNDLLRRYRAHRNLARPLLNASSTMILYFGVILIQILDFDEKNHMLTTLVWKKYVWKDELLTWDPKDYGGVDMVILPGEKVWIPDIILYNNVGDSEVEQHKNNIMLSADYNGSVLWMPPVKYESSCPVDMTDFPFDEQTCELRFGSWSYDAKKLDLNFSEGIEGFDMDQYVPNSEWEILANTAEKRYMKYPCCVNPYVDVTYRVTVRRTMTFHMRLILVPTAILSAMSAAVFWIPLQRPDRTVLGLSLFSSFFLLLILVVNSSPPTAAARLGQFYIIIILLVSLGVILSIITINIAQTRRRMPVCLEKVFINVLGLILLVSKEDYRRKVSAGKDKFRYDASDGAVIPNELEINCAKWRTFALVLDRIFFIIFFVLLVLAFACVFPKPEKLFELF